MDDSVVNPEYAAHFTHPLYSAVSGEWAPFGSDEGSDLLWSWEQRVGELSDRSTVADLLPGAEPHQWESVTDVEWAVEVLAAGFTLLRLTGQIDPDGRRLVMEALDYLEANFGDEEATIPQMRQDLASYRA